MKQSWLNTVFPIAALFSFRMLGLFMLIPVFTIYGSQLTSATPALVGIALGSYGLSQGLLQMPFGWLSDRYGRKPIITLGLVLFALGSLLGALSTSIYSLIAARTLQGMGAIGSVLIALLADLTPDEQRTKAMAVIGFTIGLSFSIAMVVSPAISLYFGGLAGIFYFTCLLACLGLLLLHGVIPTPQQELGKNNSETNRKRIQQVLKNTQLQRLNLGIFCQHFILTATFFILPMLLQQQISNGLLATSWHFYLPLMVGSFLAMIPFITIAERKRKIKNVFICSVALTGISQILLAFMQDSWLGICCLMFCYFVAFNILEASLPSLVSKQAQHTSKGTAMGVYSSSQFLGIFAGGTLAGLFYQYLGSIGIFLINGAIAFGWLGIAWSIKPYAYELTLILPFDNTMQDALLLAKRLNDLPGVNQAMIAELENTIYLQIDKLSYKEGSAETLMRNMLAIYKPSMTH